MLIQNHGESKPALVPALLPLQHAAISNEECSLEHVKPNDVGTSGTMPKDISEVIHDGFPRNESTAIKYSQPYRPCSPMEGNTQTGQRPLKLDQSEWHFKVPQQPNCDPAVGSSTQNASQASDIQFLLWQQQEAIMLLTLPQPDVPIFGRDPIAYCNSN